MTPSFPRWIVQQTLGAWRRASLVTKTKIDVLLLCVIALELLLPPVITVLAAATGFLYLYRLYRNSMKTAEREHESEIEVFIGESLTDDSLRWAVTAWSRRYRL